MTTAKEEIRKVATEHGWELTKTLGWSDEFERKASSGEKLARMMKAGDVDWQPKESVKVYYSEPGWVTDAFRYSPNDQSLLTGKFVGKAEMAQGRNRKSQVFAWLTAERMRTP